MIVAWTDEQKQKIRDVYLEVGSCAAVSRLLNVPQTTVSRFCRDLDKKKQTLSDDDVKELRNAARGNSSFDISHHAQRLGFAISTLEKAIRGTTFSHLNHDTPPARPDKYSHLREQARDLYKQGMSYNEIIRKLGIVRSSMSRWCRDLSPVVRTSPKRNLSDDYIKHMRELYQSGMTVIEVSRRLKISDVRVAEYCKALITERKKNRVKKPRKITVRTINGLQVLTDDNVIAMRKEIRESGKKNWTLYATRYKTSITTVSVAARGLTFKHLNGIELPIDDEEVEQVKRIPKVDRTPLSEELVQEILSLRRADPGKWTYGALASLLIEKTHRNYRATHVSKIIIRRDPSLKSLEEIKPVRIPREKVVRPRPVRVRRTLSVEEIMRRREEAEEQKAIEEADRYEAWVDAGKPDDWIWQ